VVAVNFYFSINKHDNIDNIITDLELILMFKEKKIIMYQFPTKIA